MIGVIGGGAFGTALAITLASDGTEVWLWMRKGAGNVNATRENAARLPGHRLPDSLRVTATLSDLREAAAVLLVLPAQQSEGFLSANSGALKTAPLVFCAKGITKNTAMLQSQLIPKTHPCAVLTGPGFADEIASGLPTALTLAAPPELARTLQQMVSRPTLRLYRSDDLIGAQLGGALKNVIAIAAGVTIGADLGESARAAIVTRGFAEIRRLAQVMGAQDQTLAGLSGFGDLMLSCASEKSRNFAFGKALGAGLQVSNQTREGEATAYATVKLGREKGVRMPVSEAVLDIVKGASVADAMAALLARPLRKE